MIKEITITGLPAFLLTYGVRAQSSVWKDAGTFQSKGINWIYFGKGTGNVGEKFNIGEY